MLQCDFGQNVLEERGLSAVRLGQRTCSELLAEGLDEGRWES